MNHSSRKCFSVKKGPSCSFLPTWYIRSTLKLQSNDGYLPTTSRNVFKFMVLKNHSGCGCGCVCVKLLACVYVLYIKITVYINIYLCMYIYICMLKQHSNFTSAQLYLLYPILYHEGNNGETHPGPFHHNCFQILNTPSKNVWDSLSQWTLR